MSEHRLQGRLSTSDQSEHEARFGIGSSVTYGGKLWNVLCVLFAGQRYYWLGCGNYVSMVPESELIKVGE